MRNSTNAVLIVVFLVVLGCSCPSRISEMGKTNSPPERAAPSNTAQPEPTGFSTQKSDHELTRAKYDKIRIGMRRSEVEGIIGGRGEEFYSGRGGGSSFVSVKWVGENFKTIIVSFRNDRVTSRSQVGLN